MTRDHTMNARATHGGRFGWGRALAIGLTVVLVLITASASAGRGVFGGKQWWSDGDGVRISKSEIEPRQVLWMPAVPVPGLSSEGADAYEPRIDAHGPVLVYVLRRPGQNADLVQSRWVKGAWDTPTPIAEINSEADELGPEVSSDGERLFFYSDREGGLGGFDLWVSARQADGRWSAPSNLGPEVNTRDNEYGPALAPDGTQLVWATNRPRADERAAPGADAWSATLRERRARHDYDLYSADLNGVKTSAVRAILELNTADDEGSPAFSPAGDFLYFASDRAGGLGGYDLLRSRIRGSRFDPAVGLDPAVNSPSNELDPTLSSDGFRLLFSSDRSQPRERVVASEQGSSSLEESGPKYALWQSVSKEVELLHEPMRVAWRELLSNLWPWLLLLLLGLLALLALLRVRASEHWQLRLQRLSLLSKCLLASLLLHALIAWLLAAWRVGGAIRGMLERPGGLGSQVVLTSASSEAESSLAEMFSFELELDRADSSTPSVAIQAPIAAEVQPAAPQLMLPKLPADAEPAMEVGALPSHTPSPDRSEWAPETVAFESHLPSPSSLPSQPNPISVAEPSAPILELLRPSTSVAVPALPQASVMPANSQSPDVSPPLVMPASVPSVQLPRHDVLPDTTTIADNRVVISPIPSARAAALPNLAAPPAVSATNTEKQDESGSVKPTIQISAPVEVATRPSTDGSVSQMLAVPLNVPMSKPAESAQLPSPTFARADDDVHVPDRVTARSVESIQSVRPHVALPANPTLASTSTDTSMSAQQAIRDLASGAMAARPSVSLPSTTTSEQVESPRSMAQNVPNRLPSSEVLTPSVSLPRFDPMAATEREAHMPRSPVAALVPMPRRAAAASLPPVPPEPEAEPPAPVEDFAQRREDQREELVQAMGGNERTEAAVKRALEWFASVQESDGHWDGRSFDASCNCGGQAQVEADAAMTGMVLLCFLGAGHTHIDEGPHQQTVKRAIDWLVARQGPDGDLRRARDDPETPADTMYGQTVASVALCEALAMTRDASLVRPARGAVAFVAANLGRRDASADETAVFGWLLMALESARRAGIDLKAERERTFDAARRWLDSIAVRGRPGEYAHARGGDASVAMTAEAMFAQQILGVPRTSSRMAQSAELIRRAPPVWSKATADQPDGAPTYYWYYATLALFEHQGASGEIWREWNERLVPALLDNQRTDGRAAGSWDPQDHWSRLGGRLYQTAVCTLSLEAYYRYLPREGAPAVPTSR